MNKTDSLSNKNAVIQEMMSSGNGLMNFYRFVAQNPHLSLREACQIVVERSNASVCFSYEEWNAMGRRINKGSKGIPYIDTDGQKRFVYDSNDTHGDGRYKRLIYPMKRLLKGFDVLNGTETSEKLGGDYKKIQSGVSYYLTENGYYTDEKEHDKLLTEGVSYFLYSKTGFPKSNGINLSGLPYDLKGNADFFMHVKEVADYLGQEIERAYVDDLNKVVVIDDTEEENVSDEPVMPSRTEIAEEEKITAEPIEVEKPVRDHPLNPIYEQYMEMQEKYPNAVVLYRLGDFYEIFGEKAKTIGEELELTITGRDFGLSERVPMVGFPYHVTDKYISKITEKHGVLVLEPDAEPKYILSHDEVATMDSEQEKSKRPALEPIEDEELNKELDGLLSEKQQETEEEDEISDEDWEEAESYLYGDEEVEESEQEETAIQPQKKEEKSIRERKKKQEQQLSLFDLIDGNTEDQKEETYEDRQEKLIKRVLCGGSGFSQGKFRIVERYNSDPSAREFAMFLKDEYGIGGSYGDGLHVDHDSKGIRAELIDKENPENNTDFLMNWNEVATKIADFIDSGEYFTAEEKEEYKQFLAERTGTVQERNNAIIEHIIKEARDRDARGYYRVWFSSLYAGYKYLTDHADEINEELVKRDGISDAYFRGEDFFVYGEALDEKTNYTDIIIVAKRLGHSDIKQTLNTYSHLMPNIQSEIVESLNINL